MEARIKDLLNITHDYLNNNFRESESKINHIKYPHKYFSLIYSGSSNVAVVEDKREHYIGCSFGMNDLVIFLEVDDEDYYTGYMVACAINWIIAGDEAESFFKAGLCMLGIRPLIRMQVEV